MTQSPPVVRLQDVRQHYGQTQALAGVTRHAAQALGLRDRGQLLAGLRADFVLWNVQHPAELAYALGANPHSQTIFQGQVL